MAEHYDIIWTNAVIATADAANQMHASGTIAAKNGRIAWLGPQSAFSGTADSVVDVAGKLITPGLVDCHTHLVFGGNRAGEYEQRLAGASYSEIAKQGGGIVSTVKATRTASEDELFELALPRLAQLMADGVTTIEIKSGYGLNIATEARMLRVARRLGEKLPISVQTTFLGAHAVPPEFTSDRSGYLDLLCNEMLPELARNDLVDCVDAFCEGIAFSVKETERVFETATALGLPVKIHAEQLSDTGGAELAARFGALSADHLEFIGEKGVAAMAAAKTTAVLLPGAYFMLQETRKPPVELFRKHGVPMALASDCNPGSSPALSLRLIATMGCQLFGMTVQEAFHAITRNGAIALGLADDRGSLQVGKRADLVVWNATRPAELIYWLGGNLVDEVVIGGGLHQDS